MTAPHHAVVTRLSAEFAAMSQQLTRVSADLAELDRLLAERTAVAQPVAPQPVSPPMPAAQPYPPPAAPYGRRPHHMATATTATGDPAATAQGAAAAARRELDRQGPRRRRRRGHADRRRAAPRARRPGRHPAARKSVSAQALCWPGRSSASRSGCIARPGGRVGAIALAATGDRRGVYERHRGHHDL